MSWKIARLADICDIKLGKTPSRSDKSYWDDEKLGSNIWVSIADLTKLNSRFIEDSKEYITDKGASLFKPVKAGTLLMSFKLSIGKLAYANCDLYTNEAIVALPIKDKNKINSDFLYYFLQFYDWDKETENDVKLKGKTLNKAKLNEITVPLPPLLIQQKIVAKLDAIFAEIDKASVAVEVNAKNAEALFQSYLTQVFETGYEGWNTKKLKEITYKITDGSHNPPKGVEYSNFLMFSSKNISNDKITFESPRFLTKEDYELENKRTQVSLGDVLLTIVGTIGRCAVVEDANLKITLQRSVSVIKPKPEINSRFLMYFFLSVNKFLNDRARGAAQKGIYLETLRDLDIRFPSVSEQESLVAKLDDFSFKAKGMAFGYQNKVEQLFFYKNSILTKAFNGDLVKE